MIRRIESKELEAKRKKRNQIILGVGLVLLMILSTAGFSLMSNEETTTQSSLQDKGYTFTRTANYWVLVLENQQFYFQHLPSEVENVIIEGTHTLQTYSGTTLYYTESSAGINEILQNLYPYVLRYQQACLEGKECEEDYPIKNCQEHIIIPISGTENKIYKEQNCVYLQGETVKTADAFLYRILGIQ